MWGPFDLGLTLKDNLYYEKKGRLMSAPLCRGPKRTSDESINNEAKHDGSIIFQHALFLAHTTNTLTSLSLKVAHFCADISSNCHGKAKKCMTQSTFQHYDFLASYN